MLVLHRCDNPSCVNPSHLFLGSHSENVADKVSKGRQARGSRSGAAKLCESDVASIKTMLRRGGMTKKTIAMKFRVSRAAVSKISTGKNWGWLE
jgi:DNA invertase Pin-like site-specific DNA recombinase